MCKNPNNCKAAETLKRTKMLITSIDELKANHLGYFDIYYYNNEGVKKLMMCENLELAHQFINNFYYSPAPVEVEPVTALTKRELLTPRDGLGRNSNGIFTVFYIDENGGMNVEQFMFAKDAIFFIDNFYLPVTHDEPTDPQNDFTTILESIGKVLSEKNKRYGNSALNPLQVFGGKSKVGTRLDDKLSRIKNNETLLKNDVADCIGYLVLICKENNWLDFSDQLD